MAHTKLGQEEISRDIPTSARKRFQEPRRAGIVYIARGQGGIIPGPAR